MDSPEKDNKPKGGAPVQLQIDDATAQGSYANLVLINHSETEFVLDFAFVQPGAPGAKVRARILSSPLHTKRLLAALQKNLERYESRFGEIQGHEEERLQVH